MNVTFMIGNGFDLRLGMKTRYTDMYDGYISTPSDNEIIEIFKATLKSNSSQKYQTWGDFEIAMAHHAKNFKKEEDFISCVRDFKMYMSDHLQNEQKSFIAKLEECGKKFFANEMVKSLRSFYVGQTPNVRNAINQIGNINRAFFQFVTFNYTNVLERLLYGIPLEPFFVKHERPIHIHGIINSDIVLGADNISQLGQLPFKITRKLERAFIKPKFNLQYDKTRVEETQRAIDQADIICIYGMSLGESDKTWIDKISSWLIDNDSHHLIYYHYSDKSFQGWEIDKKMDKEDELKESLLVKLNIPLERREEIFEQIHIPVGYDIFNFVEVMNNRPKPPKDMGKLAV